MAVPVQRAMMVMMVLMETERVVIEPAVVRVLATRVATVVWVVRAVVDQVEMVEMVQPVVSGQHHSVERLVVEVKALVVPAGEAWAVSAIPVAGAYPVLRVTVLATPIALCSALLMAVPVVVAVMAPAAVVVVVVKPITLVSSVVAAAVAVKVVKAASAAAVVVVAVHPSASGCMPLSVVS